MLIETQICQEVKQLPIVATQTKSFHGIISYCELDSIQCKERHEQCFNKRYRTHYKI